MKVILTSAISAVLGGFLISYAFIPRYTSQSLVLVEKQRVPEGLVPPPITDDFTQRMATMQQQVLAGNRLRPMIERLGIGKPGEEAEIIQEIRANMTVEPLSTDFAQSDASTAKKEAVQGSFLGVYVNYSDSSPRRAQQICNELTGLLLEENLRDRANRLKDTIDFFKRQVEDAKANLATSARLLAGGKDRAPRSPEAEAKYKVLALDHEVAQKGYVDLRSELAQAELAAQLESQQLGEQWHVLNPAGLPDAPVFPDRPLFALGGLGAGLMLGIGRGLWPVRNAKTERHVAILHGDPPVLPERRDSHTE